MDMEEIDKIKKLLKSKISKGLEKSKTFQSKIREQAEKNIELDDSDIPIHEKFVKEKHIKQLKKSKRKTI